jgi:hypothetical protein
LRHAAATQAFHVEAINDEKLAVAAVADTKAGLRSLRVAEKDSSTRITMQRVRFSQIAR